MTTIALDREQTGTSAAKVLNIALMIIAFLSSTMLLHWAVTDKFSRIGVTPTAQVTA
jgi:hypothetical protein